MKKGTLGNAIRNARQNMNMSQEELAEKVGITPTHIKHIESEHRMPSIHVLFDIVSLLNISLDNIMFPNTNENFEEYQILNNLIKGCSKGQLIFLIDIVNSLNKNLF